MRTKIDTYVEFPITDLDVRNYTIDASEPQIYDLYSIIVHHGTSGSGHFLAYIWSPENSSWFEMNDSHARPTTPEVVHSQSAYMLFYLKRDINPYFSDSDVSSTVSPDPGSSPRLLNLQDPLSSSPRRSSNVSLPSTPKSASYMEHRKNRLLRTQGDISHVRRSLRRLSDQIETTDKRKEDTTRKRLRRSTSFIGDVDDDDEQEEEEEDASQPLASSSLSEGAQQPSSPLKRPRGRPKRQIIIESD
jgi:hypothetical protein